jgi:hypothetical protein
VGPIAATRGGQVNGVTLLGPSGWHNPVAAHAGPRVDGPFFS